MSAVTLKAHDVAYLTGLVRTVYLGETVQDRSGAAFQVAGYMAAAFGIGEQLRVEQAAADVSRETAPPAS